MDVAEENYRPCVNRLARINGLFDASAIFASSGLA
jgi:hypothetical protein